MKSCIEWRKSFKYMPQIDQFNIDFRHKDLKLLQFLDRYATSQRVNIRLEPEATQDDIDLIIAIAEKEKYHIAVLFNWDYRQYKSEHVDKIKNANIPFYFSHMITDWDEYLGYLSLGVSDVFISGFLGFDIKRVARIAKLYGENVQVRCIANVCQCSWNEFNGVKSFFIRPEDIDLYDEYVDIIEFYDSIDIQNVLYDVYFHTKEWNGDLREIIKGLSTKVNSYYVLDPFGERRLDCRKKCLRGDNCKTCNVTLSLAESLENSEHFEVFKKVRKEVYNGEGSNSEEGNL